MTGICTSRCVHGNCNTNRDRCDCNSGWAGDACDTGELNCFYWKLITNCILDDNDGFCFPFFNTFHHVLSANKIL